MTITKTLTLVAAPEPTWRGTRMQLNVPTDAAVFDIAVADLAEGSESVTVDWGDGTTDTFSGGIDHITHTYASAGRHEVLISDGVESFGVNGETESAPFSECVAWAYDAHFVRYGTTRIGRACTISYDPVPRLPYEAATSVACLVMV